MRYTEKEARNCAKRLADLLGKKFGDCYTKEDGKYKSIVSCWDINYNPIYGGVQITEIVNESGGISLPLGEMRRSPREFCESVWFAEKAIELDRKMRSEPFKKFQKGETPQHFGIPHFGRKIWR